MFNKYCVVLTTVGNQQNAKEIAKELVDEHFVACAQVFPINSFYYWNDEIQDDNEYLLLLKTLKKFKKKLYHQIKTIHPYDTPEIITIPIEYGYKPYLKWISNNVR